MDSEKSKSDKRRTVISMISMVCLSLCPVAARANALQTEKSVVCYYEISNRTDTVPRVVDILLDEADFNEPELRRLLDQFKSKCLEPNILVVLYSKVEQYQDAQERTLGEPNLAGT